MKPVYLKAPVRALIYLNDTLIWGTLFLIILYLFDCLGEEDLLHFGDETIRIPGSERIIGFDSGSNDSILVRTEFNLFKYKSGELILIPLITRDRILAVLDEGDKLWVVQARGTVQLFSCASNSFTHSKSFSLSDYSAVFYSASIIRRTDTIEMAYGTIFSGILLAHIDEQSDNNIRSIGMINGHRGTIFDIKHHPTDQNILVSCSDDRSVRIWKRNGGAFESSDVCNGHEARVWSVTVRGDIIASVSEDNTCRIWDLNGNLIKVIEGDSHSKSLWSVALNNKAEMVAIGSNDSCVIRHCLNTCTKTPLDLIDYTLAESFGSIKNIILSSEGICYAATDKDKLVNIQDKNAIEIKGINKFPAMAVNSHSLFIANEEGAIFSHNLISEEFIVELLLTLNKKITKIHAQDDFLFLETVKCEYFLYSLVSKELKEIEIDKNHKITSFCKFKDQIFIGTRQGVLLVFQSGLFVKSLQLTQQQESLKSIKITRNDQISVLDRSGYEIILNFNDLTVLHRNKIGGKGVLEVHINENFFSSFYQQYFIITNPVVGVIDKIFCGGGHRLWTASSDPKSFHFAFMSNGKLTIRHGSLEKVKMVSSKSHGKEIRCSHNLKDNFLISGSEDGLLILYDGINYKNELRLTNTSIKCITSIEDLVFVGGSNETIEAFKLTKTFLNHLGSCPKQIHSIETRVLCLDAIKFDDKILLLAGYSDASIRLFEYQPNNQKFILKVTAEKVHQNRCVQQIRFLDDFKFISAGADGLLQSWTIKDGELKMSWHCCLHQSGINAIDIKTNGNNFFILTGGEDGSISFLTVKNDEIKNLTTKNVHNSTVTGVKFLKNEGSDSSFVSASIDRYIYIKENDKFKGFRTVISDISAISITPDNLLFVYGAGLEAFKL